MSKNKITKDTVPEGFSVPLALVDLLPVVFFGLSALRVGQLFFSALFTVGAAVCLVSGVVKVLWKLIAALSCKNIWPMFVQMRVFMPVGFVLMLAALIVDRAHLNGAAILAGLTDFPACLFFALGRAWHGADDGLCIPAGFQRPEGQLAGAGRQWACPDMLFCRTAVGIKIRAEKANAFSALSFYCFRSFHSVTPCSPFLSTVQFTDKGEHGLVK